jgi:hypothetical protein
VRAVINFGYPKRLWISLRGWKAKEVWISKGAKRPRFLGDVNGDIFFENMFARGNSLIVFMHKAGVFTRFYARLHVFSNNWRFLKENFRENSRFGFLKVIISPRNLGVSMIGRRHLWMTTREEVCRLRRQGKSEKGSPASGRCTALGARRRLGAGGSGARGWHENLNVAVGENFLGIVDVGKLGQLGRVAADPHDPAPG